MPKIAHGSRIGITLSIAATQPAKDLWHFSSAEVSSATPSVPAFR